MDEKRFKAARSGDFRVLPCINLSCKNCTNSGLVCIPPEIYTDGLVSCKTCSMPVPSDDLGTEHQRTFVHLFEKLNMKKDNYNASYPEKQLSGINNSDDQSESFVKETERKSANTVETSRCDVCANGVELSFCDYCRVCLQKMCRTCDKVHENLAASAGHHTEPCWEFPIKLGGPQFENVLGPRGETRDAALYIEDETGLQVCLKSNADVIELLAPFEEINDIVLFQLKALEGALEEESVTMRVRGGSVQWLFAGYRAKIVQTVFKDDTEVLVESYPEISVFYTDDWEETDLHTNGVQSLENLDNNTNGDKKRTNKESSKGIGRSEQMNDVKYSVLQISSTFDLFPIVNVFTRDLNSKIDSMHKVEVARAKKDEFRVKIYAMVKDMDPNVVCTEERNDTVVKLVIRGQDQHHVQETKQEFLSLFCKECSVCRAESSRPMYLDCKHVLCHDCVKKATCHNDGMKCRACSDTERHGTPVPPLQTHCIDVVDEIYETPRQVQLKSLQRKSTQRSKRKKNRHGKQQLSTKVPRYLLQKWSRRTGGLTRLRSLIENDFDFQTGGLDDSMKIYGQKYELLDLAIQSVEKLNERPSEHGVTCRIADKMVEWRFRGDHSRLVYFLFGKELRDLTNKFKSVTLKCFTDFHPPVVDIKCSYEEYTEVRYEIDELVNAMMFLHEDEYIQPKSFYYNIKVRDFLRSKRTDEKVFCDLRDKNNRNVIIIKSRKKEYINVTKDEIVNW